MDFNSDFQFTNDGTQAYPFMSIPPLTPSHSNSAPSEEFTSPPKDAFDQLPMTDQFQGFDYTQGLDDNSAFPGKDVDGQFSSFQNDSPVGDGKQGSPDDPNGQRGGSEEDDLTPAQSRRKAQNRAAQRAFRERKEKHVKDLETKLADLESAQKQSSVENEKLKRDLHKMSTENEILRATSSAHGNGAPSNSRSPEPMTTGPMNYKPTDFYSNVLQNHQNKVPSHRIVLSDNGEKLLAAGATWDYIISHELFKRGLVDVGDVSERLKYSARCDGQGPVFPEGAIISAIEQSVASGSDDLL